MDSQGKKQKLSSSEIADPSKKKQKVSESQVIATPCVSGMDVGGAMKKQNDVALFLAGKVISTVAKSSNFVFSPASINAVLTMAAATSDEGKLKSSILSFLRSSSTDELNAVFSEISSVVLVDGSERGGPKIAAANGVWIEQSLSVNSSWKDLFVNFFKADFAQVDFRSKGEEVCTEVNTWVSRHTNGLIKNLLPPGSVESDTDCIYGNALYFKGAWQNKFKKSLTSDKEFHLLNGKQVNVPFMRCYRSQYIEAYNGFKVLRLPYQQGDNDTSGQFSMYFYLPDKRDGLDKLVENMTTTDGFLDCHIPRGRVRVGEFRIPKFKIEFGFIVSSFFDFKLEGSLYHKALIEMDEEGTEAASASKGGRRGCRDGPPTIDFVADHPFLFVIREDKTGTVLFVGQIFDPSKSSSASDQP